MKKALIVAFHPRTMTPYSQLYEETAVTQGYTYDIVFWDRFKNAELERNGNEYIIHRICTLGGSKFKKIPAMYYFRKTVKQIIDRGAYDRIVILNTLPGVLLSDVLLQNYRGRYILDIRDYTYEKYGFYRNRVNHLIDESFISTVSSQGFYRFLKREKSAKVFQNHNISNVLQKISEIPDFKEKAQIRIGFVGAVRYERENAQLIEAFANDERFIVSYYGRFNEGCHLDIYCDRKKIQNVEFHGAFNNEEKPVIYKKIDIINSLYGNDTYDVLFLLPNRLYDSALFKKPIIVSSGTYLTEMVKKYGLGIVADNYTELKNKLLQYVDNFDSKKFNENCNRLLADVERDQCILQEQLRKFFK